MLLLLMRGGREERMEGRKGKKREVIVDGKMNEEQV